MDACVVYHSFSQQYLAKTTLNGLIAGGTGRKEGRQACCFPAAHPQESKGAPDRRSWEPQFVPYEHHKWHTNTIYGIDLVKAQEMGLKCFQSFSYAVVHFGDIPAPCMARVVGPDQTIVFERPSVVTPNAPAIRAVFRAWGGRLLDQDQQKKGLDFIRDCADFVLESQN